MIVLDGYWQIIIGGFALGMIFEGLIYALFPRQMKSMLLLALTISQKKLQYYGLGACLFGALCLWAIL